MVINTFFQLHKQHVWHTVQLASTVACSAAFKRVFSSLHLLGLLATLIWNYNNLNLHKAICHVQQIRIHTR